MTIPERSLLKMPRAAGGSRVDDVLAHRTACRGGSLLSISGRPWRISTKRGVEIDDAEERARQRPSVTLKGRLAAVAASPQPRSCRTTPLKRSCASSLAPAAPDADPEQPLVSHAGHRRRRGRVSARRRAARPAAGRARVVDFDNPGRERSYWYVRQHSVAGASGQDHPPGPDSVPERAAGRR